MEDDPIFSDTCCSCFYYYQRLGNKLNRFDPSVKDYQRYQPEAATCPFFKTFNCFKGANCSWIHSGNDTPYSERKKILNLLRNAGVLVQMDDCAIRCFNCSKIAGEDITQAYYCNICSHRFCRACMEPRTLQWDTQGHGRVNPFILHQKRGFCRGCFRSCVRFCNKHKLPVNYTTICGNRNQNHNWRKHRAELLMRTHPSSSASSSSGPTVGQSSSDETVGTVPVWVRVKRALKDKRRRHKMRHPTGSYIPKLVPEDVAAPFCDDEVADDESEMPVSTWSSPPENFSSYSHRSSSVQHHVHHHYVHTIALNDALASSSSTGFSFGDFTPAQLSSCASSDVVPSQPTNEPEPEMRYSFMVWDSATDFGLERIDQPEPTGRKADLEHQARLRSEQERCTLNLNLRSLERDSSHFEQTVDTKRLLMDPNNALISVNPPLVVPRTWTPTEVATSPENFSTYTLTSPFRFSPDSDNLSPTGFTLLEPCYPSIEKKDAEGNDVVYCPVTDLLLRKGSESGAESIPTDDADHHERRKRHRQRRRRRVRREILPNLCDSSSESSTPLAAASSV